jgi:hypothetical protein
MGNSLDLKNLAENQEFRNRVKYNLVFVASQIVGESDQTPHTEKRQSFGVLVLRTPDTHISRFSDSLVVQAAIAQRIHLSNPTTEPLTYSGSQSATTEFDGIDIEIQQSLSAIFNDIAGVINT